MSIFYHTTEEYDYYLNLNPLTAKVKCEVAAFLKENIDVFKKEAEQYGLFEPSSDLHEMYDFIPGYELTLATDGIQWNYQTGDNSFTGGAYGLPHWAILWIGPETTYQELYGDTIEQWEYLINQ